VSGITPSQTVGPYFGIMLSGRNACRQLSDATTGTTIVIEGRLFDGRGHVIPDALVEIWQADAHGRYSHPDDPGCADADRHFNGYGWAQTAADGGYRFETVKPGRVAAPDSGLQAPHILVSVMARGILARFITRLYFEDEPSTVEDPILALVPERRRATLIARRADDSRYTFDIVMQGSGETVFFDV
jgi:protocatechuate 3,4-dioxygenase alpha subunit